MSWRQPPMLILPPVRRRELPRDARSQIEWGLRYLRERYSRPWQGAALDFGRYTREEQGMDTDRALERAVALLRFQYEKFTGPSRLSTPARELELICDALERLREEQRVAVRLREQIEAGAAQAVRVGAKLDEARERLRLRALDPLTPLADPLADRPVHRGYPGNAELSRDFASYLHDAIEQRVQRGALDDVVDAEVYCSVAGCGLLDGHAGPHRESSTERCGALVHPLQAGALKVPQGQFCTRPLGHVGPHTSALAGKWYAWPRDGDAAGERGREVHEEFAARARELDAQLRGVVRGMAFGIMAEEEGELMDELADRLAHRAAVLTSQAEAIEPEVYRDEFRRVMEVVRDERADVIAPIDFDDPKWRLEWGVTAGEMDALRESVKRGPPAPTRPDAVPVWAEHNHAREYPCGPTCPARALREAIADALEMPPGRHIVKFAIEVRRRAEAAEAALADAECRSQEAEASRAKPPGRERRLVTVEGALRVARSLMAKAAQSDVAGEDARWSLANRVVDALDRIGAVGSEP
jgi:hypothetical protein